MNIIRPRRTHGWHEGAVVYRAVPEVGRVAQRDRASAFEAEGCRFEPCRGQQRSAYGALHLDEPTALDWRLYVWSGARRQTPWVRASTALKASSRETNGPSGISPMMGCPCRGG